MNMKWNLILPLMGICCFSGSLFALKVVVLYKPGFVDTMAPAQFLQHQCQATLLSVDDPGLAAKVCQEGYDELISFDSFVEPQKMNELVALLRKKNSAAKLVVYLKQGDRAAETAHFDECNIIDPSTGSYLLPVLARLGVEQSLGAQYLDSGLSRRPTEEGRKIREVYSTRGSCPEALKEIVQASPEQLLTILTAGEAMLEKAKSQTGYLASTATVQTFTCPKGGPVKVAFQTAPIGLDALGAELIDRGNDISIVLAAINLNLSDELGPTYRYSIRVGERFKAGQLVKMFESAYQGHFVEGGGNDKTGGFTTRASIQMVFGALQKYLEKGCQS